MVCVFYGIEFTGISYQKRSFSVSFDSNFHLVLDAFNVKFNEGYGELSIFNQNDFPIRDLATLRYALEVWSKSGCFFLKVSYTQTDVRLHNKISLITSQVNGKNKSTTIILLHFCSIFTLFLVILRLTLDDQRISHSERRTATFN